MDVSLRWNNHSPFTIHHSRGLNGYSSRNAEAVAHDGRGAAFALVEERRRQGFDGRATGRNRYRQGDDGNAVARERRPAQDFG